MPSRSICVVAQQYASVVSGIGVHARHLTEGLARDGHRVSLLVPANQQPTGVPSGVRVLTVPAGPFQASQARWMPLAWRFANKLREVGATDCFDIVHFTDARESLFLSGHPAAVGNANDYYSAQLESFDYYRQNYGDALQRWLYYCTVHQFERLALRRLSAVIANSDYTLAAVRGAYRLSPNRTFKCFKCIDLALFNRVTPTERSGRLVLFAGGNFQRKGLGALISSAPSILATLPEVRFVVVGADANQNRMQDLCRHLGVFESFEFRGLLPNEDLRRLYRQASVFVLPSRVEAFGLALLEAMASETPVVATRVGGIPELIEHDNSGLLIEPEQPDELAAAVLRVLTDRDLAACLGEAGRHVAQRFGVAQMLACTYRVYERVLGTPF
jgi:glycosyltransferase involved in cell wall biosynthesis